MTGDALRAASGFVCIGFDGHSLPAESAALLQGGVRAVIHFTRNYSSPSQMSRLNAEIRAAAGGPVLTTVDHEGGRVQRFRGEGFPDLPSGRDLGLAGPEASRAAGLAAAQHLRAAGFNMNLAPVLDVDSNPANPVIGARAFSQDPLRAAECAVAYAEGLRAGGMLACGKHFPGHGDTNLDSHLDLPRLPHGMDRLEAMELVPFRAAVGAGIDAIMTAHVLFEALDPGVPATLSREVVTGLLRKRLGFDGLVLTDDFEMQAIADRFELGEAAVRSIEAGCDLVLACHRLDRQHRIIEAIASAIDAGRIPESRIRESQKRLQRLLEIA
jgi:beta-N-acetylhexosaminidase